jgi:tRNA threonylcarbamoyladenosine biosynthesis protein TsaB
VHVLILSLDTSSSSGSIAIARDEQLVAVVSTTTEETYSSRIFRQLEFLLSEADLNLSQFDVFAVNAGPGSFTGLRVGLTSAKAWAEAFSKPIVAVSGLEAVAVQAAYASEWIVPVLDARRSQLYTGLYRNSSSSETEVPRLIRSLEDAVVSPAWLLDRLSKSPDLASAILATPSASWLRSALAANSVPSHAPLNIREVSSVLAPVIARLAYQRASRGETVDALRLDANYVRRSDAELNWKEK